MKRILLLIGVYLVASPLFAQVNLNRFDAEIRKFEIEDSISGIKKGAILFTGSSSIRMWKTLEADMAPLKVLNRGFGGSTIPEVTHYADRIILPYRPDIIVLYCGENDISNDQTTSEEVFMSFKEFHKYLRKNLPKTQLYYISMKPSVLRWKYWPKVNEANLKIEAFIKRRKNYHYIDTATKMLDSDGMVFQDIFIQDNLHMNEKGYAIWTEVIKPELERAVAP
ncbi:MAG: SGNH/GDSL hydrolase family protein [Cyclobacteriaceae bacterium]|nr:SGNH/GDSL hydrolase family protein [Cyclobacteriaceae bacterium]